MSKTEKPQPDLPVEGKATSGGLTPEKTSEQKFPLEKLRVHCRKLFNVSTNAFDGATSGLSGEFTIERMKQIISAWGEKPVITPKKKEDN